MNTKVKKTLKFFLYFFGKLFAAAVTLALVWFIFMTALNTSNIQIMVKDAFTKRASVILDPEDNPDKELISKIFTEDYLLKSGLNTQTDNRFYDVTLYSQRTDVELRIVFPYAKKAEITVTDVVEDIRANLVNEDHPEFKQKQSLMSSGVYKVSVIKTDQKVWLIDDIELVEEVIPEIVRPLPTPQADVESVSE